MASRMVLMLVAVGLIVAGIGFLKYRSVQAAIAQGESMAPPPSAVATFVVESQAWQPTLTAVGTADAVQGVVVSTDLPGIVREIAFESGRSARKDEVLVKLDTTQEEAQLNAASARLELAKVNLARNKDLLGKRVASQSDYDASTAEYKQAAAAVNEIRALIDRKTIRAPFDGLLGIRQIDLGQYLQSGDGVVPLQSLDPIFVNFNLPQQNLAELEIGRPVEVTVDGFPGVRFEGQITAIDPNVNASTRNVRVQATLQNPEGKIRSGMFVNVSVLLPQRSNVLAIPASAVDYAPYGNSVFVVQQAGDDKEAPATVSQKFVKLGATRGDLVEVVSGLEAGQEIVSSGTFKVRDGAPVDVQNDIQPGTDPAPNPPNS